MTLENSAYLFLVGACSLYLLWIFYLAVMSLQRAWSAKLLNKTAKVLGAPILFIGLALDAFVNIFVMTLLFLEFPQELFVTDRLKRHIKESSSWRLRLGTWFIPLLDPFDPSGRHITEKQK